VSQVGELLNESILQAKGQHYTLQELLAGDEESIAT
jgi:phosphatidylserine decarboxylase